MKDQSISTAELARNVAMSIDKVRLSGQALDITKGSQVVASLVPRSKPGLPIRDLIELLSMLSCLKDKGGTFTQDWQPSKKEQHCRTAYGISR